MTEQAVEEAAEPYPWLPSALVVDWFKLDGQPTDAVEQVRQAAADYCERQRPDLQLVLSLDGVVVGTQFQATPSVVQAGLLSAGRLWERRNTPAGLASFAEFGAADILRVDPDVARLLGTGRHARPRVG